MELESYFETITFSTEANNSLGVDIVPYQNGLDWQDQDLAILFVPECRWDEVYEDGESDSLFARKLIEGLGRLFPHGFRPRIINLGAFRSGESLKDTETGLTEVLQFLVEQRITPIMIGKNRQINYSAYKVFEQMEQIVNLSAIDPYLNVDTEEHQGYIGRIIKEQPNYLFNYCNLGYQTYLIAQEELELSEELYFEAYRLGALRGSIQSAEPVLRGSEIISCSMEAVRASDFSSSTFAQPNGIFAEEVCQLMRYAGLTDRNKILLITELDWVNGVKSEKDILLLAEMLWCYVDGFYHRKAEMPSGKRDGFLKYRVPLRDDEFQLIFYKSINTDRWWMEVPVPPQYSNKYKKHHMIPCDYDDYQIATSDDLPERWWKAYKKML